MSTVYTKGIHSDIKIHSMQTHTNFLNNVAIDIRKKVELRSISIIAEKSFEILEKLDELKTQILARLK